MAQPFLYELLDGAREMGLMPASDIPAVITSNLNPALELRQYQKEAFTRFIHCHQNSFGGKQLPLHLLFNMATGSGKTLIMAGVILYLYDKGHRNFLFFVNSNNIIAKTRENFLDSSSYKYLFAPDISVNNKKIKLRETATFADSDPDAINICFTTIQKLHSDLTNEKENSLSFEDFSSRIVMLSDEAHHTQKVSRGGTLDGGTPSWENTVERIFKGNTENLLLEFTATMDFLNQGIKAKYLNKVLYRYDLKQFRNDGYSKDPEIFATDTDRRTRMLQAILVSQYRQEVATANGIALKPVVLLKAQGTIAQSHENKALFHQVIETLTLSEINRLKTEGPELIKKAFNFFEKRKITNSVLIKKLQQSFAPNKCLTVNEESLDKKTISPADRLDVLAQQKLLNSLENENNQIRAIFAVQKLNEGWDVLNLFDIVRMYETRDSRDNKPGKTTISEAQLIGRGARYYPFSISLNEGDDRYVRKYDSDLENPLRMLEELHYHCHPGDKSRYIVDIKKALVTTGLLDSDLEEVDVKLKEEFKKTGFYKSAVVYGNEKVKNSFSEKSTIGDLLVSKRSHSFRIHSGKGAEENLLSEESSGLVVPTQSKERPLLNIEFQVVRAALARNNFFTFENLILYFPSLKSVTEFVISKKYLAGLSIVFLGTESSINSISRRSEFEAILSLLSSIENELRSKAAGYKGTKEFKPIALNHTFKDKRIKVSLPKAGESLDDLRSYLNTKAWYVYDSNYGTSEERSLIELTDRLVAELKPNFKDIYLVRNEQELKIFNFEDGRGFEPDFLLFLTTKNGTDLTYQLFIEPKGTHLLDHDAWKEAFLQALTKEFGKKAFKFKSKKYRIVGLPFYNNAAEVEFISHLKALLK